MSTRVGLADRIFLLQESSDSPQHVAALGTFELPPDAAPDYLKRLVASYRSARTFAPPFNYRLRSPALKAVAPGLSSSPTTRSILTSTSATARCRPPAVSASSECSCPGCTRGRSTSTGRCGRCT